jgi:hypothetical protein
MALCPHCGTDIFRTGWGSDRFSIGDNKGTKGWVIICASCKKILGFLPEKPK